MKSEIIEYEDFIMSNDEKAMYVAPVIMSDYKMPALTMREEIATSVSNYLNHPTRLEYLESFGAFFIGFAGVYCLANAAVFLLQQL